jgi:hypothetical protein
MKEKKMSTNFTLGSLAIQQPRNEANCRQLRITLAEEGQTNRKLLLALDDALNAPGKCPALEFPVPMKQYQELLWSPDRHQAELVLPLASPVREVIVHDLSSTPSGWTAMLRSIFARNPAAMGMVVHQGWITFGISNGD